MDTTRRDRTPVDRWGGESQRPLSVCLARIAAVREIGGVPIGAYDVVLDNGQQERDVPMLLPASSHMFRGGRRQHGASGVVPIASVGDNCLVIYVGHQVGLAQPFVLGFFAPRREGRGGDYPNPKRVRPGSLVMATPYGNGIVLRNGGIIEIESEPHVKRVMTPAAASATDVTASMIADRCRNYRLLTASGELRFGEAGGGKSALRFRVSDMSSYKETREAAAASSLAAVRTVANSALSEGGPAAIGVATQEAVARLGGGATVQAAAGAAAKAFASGQGVEGAALAAGGAAVEEELGDLDSLAEQQSTLPAVRFVEVTWGATDTGDLAVEEYAGPGGRTLVKHDGSGGMRVEADQSVELEIAGGIVQVSARADGTLETTSVMQDHTVLGLVTYNVTAMFQVQAPLIALNGIVVIQGGGLPSARMTDLVLVGGRVGEIITGQPNLIH